MSKKARSRLFAAFVIAAAAAALLAGYRWGTRSARQAAAGRWFRITGPSMAPTLSPGQRCLLRPLDRRPQIGDVVAVRWDGHRRIKRVAAVGGDTVSISAGRLLVNGQRLEDRLALQGQHRRDGFIPPAQVAVPGERSDWTRVEDAPQWLLYAHRNRHAGGRLTAVMDDYPVNRNVQRRLNPVDRLGVEVTRREEAGEALADDQWVVAFFDAGERQGAATERERENGRDVEARNDPRSVAVRVMATEAGVALFREAEPWEDATRELMVPETVRERLDVTHPIAVRVPESEADSVRLRVIREIEYRDDRRGAAQDYPRRLAAGEVFLVGDNVPVSVDSRQLGPVDRRQLLGRIVLP